MVTGAGRGIGRAIALAFAGAGANLVLVARTRSQLEETAALVHGKGRMALVCPTDLSDDAQVQRMVREALAIYARVDVLVNNAGVFVRKRFEDLSTTDWDRTMAVNLRGAFLCAKAFLPGMSERRWGRIVNVASVHGRVGDAMLAAHCASKFGMVGLTESLAREYRDRGVSVNAVCPGAVDPKADPSRPPLERKLLPEEVARAVLSLASDPALTGVILDLPGGSDPRIEAAKIRS